MRLALLVPVLISVAAPAYADGVRESRYSPTTPRQAEAAAVARYDGPMLGWANKRAVTIATPSAPAAPPVHQTAPAPAAYAPAPVANAPAPPTSLYAAPRPPVAAAAATAPALPAATKDWSSYRSSRMTSVAPPAPQQVAAANTGVTGARYYSVDRDYGLTPDAVPPAGPDRQVLITADAPPPEPKDATPVHGSADWLAAGVAGDDDQDDSASRRAKTRNESL